MNRLSVVALSCVAIIGVAHADCLKGNSGIPPGANTTDRSAPFYIDTTGLDLQNLAADARPEESELSPRDRIARRNASARGAEGNFIIGPTHKPAPELAAQAGVPAGKVYSFTHVVERQHGLQSRHDPRRPEWLPQRLGLHRETAPGDKSNLLVPTAHAGIWTRAVDVYVPPGYVAGTRNSVHRPWRRRSARLFQ